MSKRNRLTASLVLAAALTSTSAGSVLGHSQAVTPPGVGEAVVDGPNSNAWAQAHCNAASPALIGERSNGVVQFPPAEPKECPLVALRGFSILEGEPGLPRTLL